MAFDPSCPCTPDEVNMAFRKAEPFIDQQIADRTYKMARYMVDYAPVKLWPDGVGDVLSKVIAYSDIGPQYDNYDLWYKSKGSRASSSHEEAHDRCGYKWNTVGFGFDTKHYEMMETDLKTDPICVKDIRTYWQFEQMQNIFFNSLAEISLNIREQLNRNTLIKFAVKHVITSKGLEINSADPYTLPNIAGVELGRLNFRILKRLYNALVREAGMYALDRVNGRPVFGIIGSDDVLDDLFLEDPEIRQDLRNLAAGGNEAGMALLERYNLFEGIRNMFITIPDIAAPRYRDDGAGNLIRVFPYVRNVAIEVGTRPAPNPDYETAEYELVLFPTRDTFCLRAKRSLTSVGGQTDFGAETGMLDWKWFSTETYCDPARRRGFYFANGELGVEPGDFTDFPGVLVKRRPMSLDASFWPAAICPPTPVDCNNQLAAQGCPCAAVIDCCPVFSNPNQLQLRFSSDITGQVTAGQLQILLSTGGVAEGAATIAADGLSATVDFGEPVECRPDLYVEVLCNPSELCSTCVVTDTINATTDTNRDVRVKELLHSSAVVGSTISAKLEDGTFVDVTIVSLDADSLIYEVAPVTPGAFDNKCIVTLCVPPALVPECPACEPADEECDPTTGLP